MRLIKVLLSLVLISFTTMAPMTSAAQTLMHPQVKTSEIRKHRFHLLPPHKSWRFKSTWSFVKTDKNFDDSGQEVDIGTNAEVSQHVVNSSFEYTILKSSALRFEIDFRILSATRDIANATTKADQSGLGDMLVAWRQSIQRNPEWDIALEGSILIASYSADEPNRNSEINRGNGSTDMTVKALVRKPMGSLAAIAQFGYTNRSSGYSGHFPYKFGFQKEKGDFYLGAFLQGQISQKNDDFAPGSTLGTSNWLRSNINNAVNPTRHEANLGAGLSLSDTILLKGGVAFPISAKNSYNGNSIFAGIVITPAPTNPSINSTPNAQAFEEFSLEAEVIQVSSRVNYLRIDKGNSDDIEKGQFFEIYPKESDSSMTRVIAAAKAIKVGDDYAVLKIMKYYREILIEVGMRARRVILRPR